ncbi:hypothetical protein Sjap_008778 [Stephania japonica]|uniref:Uncharacterized protein n=1 Tax=Stephania japonica TaxID=461633 RepID=A0AAP0JQW9_9MAGN
MDEQICEVEDEADFDPFASKVQDDEVVEATAPCPAAVEAEEGGNHPFPPLSMVYMGWGKRSLLLGLPPPSPARIGLPYGPPPPTTAAAAVAAAAVRPPPLP